MNNFRCQHCQAVCEWESRIPVADQQGAPWKTIGNRYCHEVVCIEAEAVVHGVPVERVMEWHGLNAPNEERCGQCDAIVLGYHACPGVPG